MINIWLFFLLYAFLGWMLEVAYQYYKTGKLANRGFLHGPFVPLYGFGLILVHLFYTAFLASLPIAPWVLIILLFGFVTVISSLIELLTGMVIEALFKIRYWDYSEEPCNLNGFITCKFSLIWGVLGTLTFVVLHMQGVMPMTERINTSTKSLLSALLLAYFLIDWTLSVIGLINFSTYIHKLETARITVRTSLKSAARKQKARFDDFKTLHTLSEIITESKAFIKETVALSHRKHLNSLIDRVSSSRLYKAFPHVKIKAKQKKRTDKDT